MFDVVLGAVTVSIGLTFWWALVAIGAGTLIGARRSCSPPCCCSTSGHRRRTGHPGPGHDRRHRRADYPRLDRHPRDSLGGDRDLRLPVDPLGHAGHRRRDRRGAGHHARPGAAVRRAARPRDHLGPAGLRAPGRGRAAGHREAVFGPFVSDYTRYLPANTSGRRLFWAIYAGSVLATFFSCAIGAYLAALLPALGPVAAIGAVSGKWALIIMALSLMNANTFNAYTGAFQVLAFASMWRRFRSESAAVRVIPYLCVMAAGVVTAYLGYQSFVTNLTNFLDVLLVIFIPWSAVNLADYFVVRRGAYDVASFFTADGAYGRFAWRGLLAYAIGLAAEWPFVSQPDYAGPLVKTLGGADISWLVGWFAAALAYLLLIALAPDTARHERTFTATAGQAHRGMKP